MGLTKLDTYDYVRLPGVIRIRLQSSNDPTMVDVLSEIENSNGRIYLEGYFYDYLDDYRINRIGSYIYMELKVTLSA